MLLLPWVVGRWQGNKNQGRIPVSDSHREDCLEKQKLNSLLPTPLLVFVTSSGPEATVRQLHWPSVEYRGTWQKPSSQAKRGSVVGLGHPGLVLTSLKLPTFFRETKPSPGRL